MPFEHTKDVQEVLKCALNPHSLAVKGCPLKDQSFVGSVQIAAGILNYSQHAKEIRNVLGDVK